MGHVLVTTEVAYVTFDVELAPTCQTSLLHWII